ncbi:hypothetical protein AYO40_03900 [Planctomycetaceae bacterium SCGC AG-212-D15]|nr:hypothetical protein AYO40_03900 [Planctomycetaceae bacterium SCGC AG-212-D15]
MRHLLPLSVTTLACLTIGFGSMSAQAPKPAAGDKGAAKDAPQTGRAGTLRPADLALEAEQTREPAIRDLYLKLAVPHDLVYWSDTKRNPSRVAPVARRIDTETAFSDKVKLSSTDPKVKTSTFHTRDELRRVEPYEEIAQSEVRALLDPRGPARGVPRLVVLHAAERALAVVMRFHELGRRDGTRDGAAWDAVGKRLQEQLLQVQADTLKALAAADDWDRAYEMAERLARSYRKGEIQARLAEPMSLFIDRALKADRYTEFHERLKLLQEIFSEDAVSGPLNKVRERKAGELFGLAKQEKDQAKAVALLTTAENLWPRLAGLREYRLKLTQAYPILYVGVPELPERMSPGAAASDSERWAVELLFESLVRPAFEPGIGERYQPVLSAGRPGLLPLGREFTLLRDAFWSDGKRVTAMDVRGTVELLRKSGAAGLLDEARLGDDSSHVQVMLRQGFVDPLGLMAFKVLPESARLERPDDGKFAAAPVGSGPFVLDKRDKDSVTFVANKHYRREGKVGLPRVREVRFLHLKDPAEDFRLHRLHLLLDPDTVMRVQKNDGVKTYALPNRRIYFLAVNHRRGPLKDPDLRQALDRAIHRTKILDEVFRAGWSGEGSVHRSLSGAYPPGSWACPPGVTADTYNLSAAKGLASKAKQRVSLRLSLKYPDGDARVARACELIRIQAGEAGIELRTEPRSPQQLREEVEIRHDYDLAYYHWDYTSEAYLLWPLLDPGAAGTGGSNFLGYQPNADLQGWFNKARNHRDFGKIKEYTHTIAGLVHEQLPFIPLWQLDTLLAVHDSVQTVPEPRRLDPLGVFTEIERWEIK